MQHRALPLEYAHTRFEQRAVARLRQWPQCPDVGRPGHQQPYVDAVPGRGTAAALLGQGLHRRKEDRVPVPPVQRDRGVRGERSGRGSRAAAGALRLGRTVGAALSEQRVLATAEAKIVVIVAVIALLLAICTVMWPWVAAAPMAVLLAWASLVLFTRAFALRRERQRRGLAKAHLERTPSEPGPPPP